jgi:DNA/RNA-binding domain of Phe-tRNA-synthetase-like protein
MGIHRDPDGVPQQFDDAVLRHGPTPLRGRVAPDVARALPDLELLYLEAGVAVTTRSPDWARERLAHLSTTVRGLDVLNAHLGEAPRAYRELYRSVGRDPDEDRPPMERAYVERLALGGFPQVGLPADVLTIVLAETGVPLWGVDAGLVSGVLGIRRAVAGELPVPRGADPALTAGHLVVADDHGVVAELCRPPLGVRAIDRGTTRAVFFTVRPRGISDLRVREAFWTCGSLLADP